LAARYTYDPYGKVLTATGTFAATNPLRYRGYVYDTETGFYYLQSRYYDPAICRFLNADAFASTGQGIIGNNMFAYCLNNPVTFEDDTGSAAKLCFSDNDRIEEAPWIDHSPGGGGIPLKDYRSGPNDYGSIADKFYTIRLLKALGIDELSDFKPVSKMGKGIKSIYDGISLILAPVPTEADDLVGMYKITAGIINTCWGFAEWVGDLIGK